jgi:hypothetical protein
MNKILLILLITFSFPLWASTNSPENLGKYPKKLRAKIQSMLDNNQTIDEAFKLSVNENTDVSKFNYHRMVIEIEAPVEKVWKAYTETDLRILYHTKKVEFVMGYDRHSNQIFEKNYELPIIAHVGTGLFVQLKYIEGAMKMVTATEITKIDGDSESPSIEFTYFEDGASQGRQYVTFTEVNNVTYVIHESRFLCQNKMRNKLYPHFHEMALANFHENIGELLGVKARWLK